MAAPALFVGCTVTPRSYPEATGPGCVLDIDGKRSSFDRVDGLAVIRNQVGSGVPGPAQVRQATLPEPSSAGWRFSSTDAMVANVLPGLTEFSLLVVVDARSGGTGRICTLTDARNVDIHLVLADIDSIAIWSRGVELMRVEDTSIALRPCVFAMTFDSSRIVQGFLNGAHVATYSGQVGFGGVGRLTLGAKGRQKSFDGMLQQLRCWDHAVSGTTLRREFDSLGATWGVGIIPLIGKRLRSPGPLPKGLKGSCVIPRAADIDDGSAWQNFWTRWDWDWVRESIDLAVEAGSRTIRIVGDVGAMLFGAVDPGSYRRRLDQFTAYCRRRGLSVYYCLLDLRHTPLDRLDEVEPLVTMIAKQLSTYDNVVAVELCNEVSVIYPQIAKNVVFAHVTRWAATIRNETDLPLSVSDVHTGELIEKLTDRAEMSRWREVIDFFDIHVYRPPHIRSRTNYLAPYELATDIPLVFGEVGASRDEDVDRVAVYRSIGRLATSSERVHGVYQWGLINDEYGLMAESGRDRQNGMLAAWRRFEPSV
ncbi:hypothetical protein [Gordonia sp. SL306]|uniref:hypothetical protein n=1 Tax=Gordonia sp. SL306 TaxID=2995145 RepID=UPI00226DCF88|nr:hypothetical protein [Gordonia sp. SL306]WAC56754.1 hypothetical protein OVA31_05730 [Gordonia sp. SL306]